MNFLIFNFLLVLFVSCKNSFNSSQNETRQNPHVIEAGEIISSQNVMPNCTDEREGKLFYIKNISSFRACSGGEWTDIDLKGQDGAKGEQGIQGLQGEKGAAGEAGLSLGLFNQENDSLIGYPMTITSTAAGVVLSSTLIFLPSGAHYLSTPGLAESGPYMGYLAKMSFTTGRFITFNKNKYATSGDPRSFHSCYYPNTSCHGSCGFIYAPEKNAILVEFDHLGKIHYFKVSEETETIQSYDLYNDLSFYGSDGVCRIFSSNLIQSTPVNLYRSSDEFGPEVSLFHGFSSYLGLTNH